MRISIAQIIILALLIFLIFGDLSKIKKTFRNILQSIKKFYR